MRSKRLDGKTIGVMVTASHNPEAVSSITSNDEQPQVTAEGTNIG